ncbi:Hachiman antiphage defense system protein HamA [Megasphaera cerevisiae]|uniref:Hachiman antiphage defense system protein HamA n=1 Tax=Megasphaera cerevisiae TaxID=39029 RepID=UPI000944385A|nr:Hachiman antiphage defense system protein HamA [Megasphaera cerevisiae]OKY53735.1 hypothetical protein BSR42_06215 [Megasphaera cerevisiae]
MTKIIKDHPIGSHPFARSLLSVDENTLSKVEHRALSENGHNDILLEYMTLALQEHHISPEALNRHQELIRSLKIAHCQIPRAPYPQDVTTQKGNFAEIFLAEYLSVTTDAQLPIYRLRYNPNPDQSMKGDDVLLFDLDSDPVRIIVGESKFRKVPTKQSVIDIVDNLARSNRIGLPVSLMFVSERLFQENKTELGEKVQACAVLFAKNRLCIDYVGLLMSNSNVRRYVNRHTSDTLHNLLMISLGMDDPEIIVKQAFARLEENT